MERLKRRTDFRAAATGARAPARAFVLQARRREAGEGRDRGNADTAAVRVGFTVSRQVGNAVERNRVRRRLREMVRLAAPAALAAGHDYVLIGRRTALNAAFADMAQDFVAALRRVNAAVAKQAAKTDATKETGAATGAPSPRPPHKSGPTATGQRRASRPKPRLDQPQARRLHDDER